MGLLFQSRHPPATGSTKRVMAYPDSGLLRCPHDEDPVVFSSSVPQQKRCHQLSPPEHKPPGFFPGHRAEAGLLSVSSPPISPSLSPNCLSRPVSTSLSVFPHSACGCSSLALRQSHFFVLVSHRFLCFECGGESSCSNPSRLLPSDSSHSFVCCYSQRKN